MMSQQMMMSGGEMGMQNMSESEMQQAMNFQICFPTMGEEMMQHMQDMMGMVRIGPPGTMNGLRSKFFYFLFLLPIITDFRL